MQYSEQQLPDGQKVRYADIRIQSMQYGLSNHRPAAEPGKRKFGRDRSDSKKEKTDERTEK